MRVSINITVNLRPETIEAFRFLEGDPSDKRLSEYILANGVAGLDELEAEWLEIIGEAA